MKYQIGDKVLLLHSQEEGSVIDIIGHNMLLVDVGGVTFPVYADQVDFPYFRNFSSKKIVSSKKEKQYVDDIKKEKGTPATRIEDGVWLTFLPVMTEDEFGDEVVEELKVHLNNHTKESFHFTYRLHFFGKPDFELKNQLNPFEDFYLHDVPFSDLNDNPNFSFEFSLQKPDKRRAEYYETSLRLKPRQLFSRIEEMRKNNQATFTHLLFEKYPDRPYEEPLPLSKLEARGFKIYDAGRVRENLEPPRSVIDLHIEKLTDNWKQLDNFAIMDLQLKTFEKYYDLALAHHQATLIVIHGVGAGTLRDEIHDILRLKKEVSTFVNRYDPRFGYGATEIFFKT
jgi:hypothetical protein